MLKGQTEVYEFAAERLHDTCVDVCGDKANLPFLSLQEGLCFRNCLTKFSNFFPTLQPNLQSAEFMYLREVNEKLA